MAKTALATLNGYFNSGDGVSVESAGGDNCRATVAGIPAKRPTRDFAAEIRDLTADDKNELAQGVSDITGEPFTPATK